MQGRILHILPHRGGGGEVVVEMLSELDEFEHERIHLAEARTPLRAAPSLALGLRRARREAARADLLNVVGDTAALLCAPLFRRHPAVWGTQGLHLTRRVGGPLGGVVRRRLRIAIGRSRRTVCSSAQELAELSTLLDPSLTPKLIEVTNAVPLPPPPSDEARAAARRELGLDDEALVALFVGELEQRKRPLDAAEAAARAAGGGLPVTLLVAGGGPLSDEVAARGGDAVRVLGFQPDPVPLFVAADVFLQPSEREGLSLALLEAMAHGLAIVASDAPGNLDSIGDAGLLHRVGDVELLAALLTRLARPDERRRLGVAARARAESRFSFEGFLAAWSEIFEAAMRPG